MAVAECEWRRWYALNDEPAWYRTNQCPRVEPTHWMPLPAAPTEAPEPAPPQAPPKDPTSGLWRCSSCGEAKEELPATSWRWTGTGWEHKCGDPQAGYFEARFFGAPDHAAPPHICGPESACDSECAARYYEAIERREAGQDHAARLALPIRALRQIERDMLSNWADTPTARASYLVQWDMWKRALWAALSAYERDAAQKEKA